MRRFAGLPTRIARVDPPSTVVGDEPVDDGGHVPTGEPGGRASPPAGRDRQDNQWRSPLVTAPRMRAVTLPDGTAAPALGMGTWYLGEDPGGRDVQLDALRTGIDIGLTL